MKYNQKILLVGVCSLFCHFQKGFAFVWNPPEFRSSSKVSRWALEEKVMLTSEEKSSEFTSIMPTIETAQALYLKHERYWKNYHSTVDSSAKLGYEMLLSEFDPTYGCFTIHTGTRHSNKEKDEEKFIGLEKIYAFLKTWSITDKVISIEFHDPVYSSNSYISSFTTKWTNSQDLHGLQRGYVICHFFNGKITEYSVYLNTNDYMRYLFMEDYVQYSESNKLLNI